MTYLTILEKLQILFNTILNFKVVLSFIVVMLLITILYTFKVLNKKKYSILMSISFVLLFGISIISNYKMMISNVLFGASSVVYSLEIDNIFGIMLGIIWIIAPLIMYYISKEIRETKPKEKLSMDEISYIARCAEKATSL